MDVLTWITIREERIFLDSVFALVPSIFEGTFLDVNLLPNLNFFHVVKGQWSAQGAQHIGIFVNAGFLMNS